MEVILISGEGIEEDTVPCEHVCVYMCVWGLSELGAASSFSIREGVRNETRPVGVTSLLDWCSVHAVTERRNIEQRKPHVVCGHCLISNCKVEKLLKIDMAAFRKLN